MFRFTVIILLFIFLSLLSSCAGDCKKEVIEKAEWETTFEDLKREVFVKYSVPENKIRYNKSRSEALHTITIKNDDNKYSTRFSVSIDYGFVNDYSDSKNNNYESEYIEISPNSTHTFTYSRVLQRKSDYFNSNVIIHQKPYIEPYKKRVDKLNTANIEVNSCEVNIESLAEKYKATKDLFNSKSVIPEESAIATDEKSNVVPTKNAYQKGPSKRGPYPQKTLPKPVTPGPK